MPTGCSSVSTCIGCAAIEDALHSRKTILLDEIGKMELFSDKFKNTLLEALNSPQKLLASIMERRNEFADGIKNRTDVKLALLCRNNFEALFTEIQNWIKEP